MMPFCSPAWFPTATHLLRKLRSSAHVTPLHRLGHGLIAGALLGATTLSSAGYSTGGGTLGGTGAVPTLQLQLTNTAVNPTLVDSVTGPSSTNPPTASFSVPPPPAGSTIPPQMDAYLGYRLDIKNNNTVVPITGTITLTYKVQVLNSAPAPTYDSMVLPSDWTLNSCTQTTPKGFVIQRVCTFALPQGGIPSGATRSVTVFLKSPTTAAFGTQSSCSNATTTYTGKCVRLVASAASSSPAYTSNGANEEILLGPESAANRAIKAYTAVRPAGGTLYTGYDSATTTGQFYSRVIVPTFNNPTATPPVVSTFVTSARLIESGSGGTAPGGCNSGSAFNLCSRVDVTVPAPGGVVASFYPQVLQIRLRIDSTNIISPSSTGLANTVLYYQAFTGATPSQILNCSPANTALSVGSGPCINARSLSGNDYIFDLISYTNGGYYFR